MRTDVQHLSEWLDREVARGATEVELRDTRSTLLDAWPGGSALDLAAESVLVITEGIVKSAEADLDRLSSSTVLAVAPHETPRVVEITRDRTVLVVARGPRGIATLRLLIAAAAVEPAASAATVLRLALRRIERLTEERGASIDFLRQRLLEGLVDILLATDARIERLAEHLEPQETAFLVELLAPAR